jgi:glycosyltransferase involved in cell wall biosynthesis
MSYPSVLGIHPGMDFGGAFYRMLQPFALLRELGYPFDWKSGLNSRREHLDSTFEHYSMAVEAIEQRKYNIVALQRPPHHTLEELPILKAAIEEVHSQDALICVDIDDDLWTIEEHNPASEVLTPEIVAALNDILREFDFITCSTPFLAERVLENTSLPVERLHVTPNLIDVEDYDYAMLDLGDHPDFVSFRQRGSDNEPVRIARGRELRKWRLQRDHLDPIVIGLQGSQSHFEDWKVLAPALERVSKLYGSRLRFIIAGYHPDYLREALAQADEAGLVWWKAATPFNWHSHTVLRFDINLCPLAATEFNLSKSPIKWLEGAAAGAASIVSPTVYGEYVTQAETALIATTVEEWELGLRLLIENPKLRREVARNAQVLVRSEYNLQSEFYYWGSVYPAMWEMYKG